MGVAGTYGHRKENLLVGWTPKVYAVNGGRILVDACIKFAHAYVHPSESIKCPSVLLLCFSPSMNPFVPRGEWNRFAK